MVEQSIVKEVAGRFEVAAKGSGGFLWMGVLKGVDEYSRAALDVYLSERSGKSLPRRVQEKAADAIEAFDEVALAMEPEFLTTLHLVRTQELRPRSLRRTLVDRESSGWILVYEASLR